MISLAETNAETFRKPPLSELRLEILSATQDYYQKVSVESQWCSYFVQRLEKVVGVCSFKGSPNRECEVELAYFIFPEFEGQGVATRAVQLLIEKAKHANPSVIITAQTLPEENASTKVLEKNQFVFRGELDHPEDGRVWKWIWSFDSGILIIGNSASGKSTLSKLFSNRFILDLDTVAWKATEPPTRQSIEESLTLIKEAIASHSHWVIEGCYGDLASQLLERKPFLIFMDVGEKACLENCQERLWEPHKYESKEHQDKNLSMLKDWIKSYYTRTDEMSYSFHASLYQSYHGPKIRIQKLSDARPEWIYAQIKIS